LKSEKDVNLGFWFSMLQTRCLLLLYLMRYHKVSKKQRKKGGNNNMVSQVDVNLDTINIYLISDIIDLISSQ